MARACKKCGAPLADEGFPCPSCRTYFMEVKASAPELKAVRWWHVVLLAAGVVLMLAVMFGRGA